MLPCQRFQQIKKNNGRANHVSLTLQELPIASIQLDVLKNGALKSIGRVDRTRVVSSLVQKVIIATYDMHLRIFNFWFFSTTLNSRFDRDT